MLALRLEKQAIDVKSCCNRNEMEDSLIDWPVFWVINENFAEAESSYFPIGV